MEKENIDFVEEKKNGEGTRKRRKIFRKLKYLVHGGEAKKEKEKAGNNWKRKIFFGENKKKGGKISLQRESCCRLEDGNQRLYKMRT